MTYFQMAGGSPSGQFREVLCEAVSQGTLPHLVCRLLVSVVGLNLAGIEIYYELRE